MKKIILLLCLVILLTGCNIETINNDNIDSIVKSVLTKDIDLAKYYYLFRINDEYLTSLDPYGVSTNELKTYNYVIDLDSVYQQKYGYVEIPKEKSIIYEMNIRDFSSTLDVEHPGTFMGLIESKKIKDKGINYITNNKNKINNNENNKLPGFDEANENNNNI